MLSMTASVWIWSRNGFAKRRVDAALRCASSSVVAIALSRSVRVRAVASPTVDRPHPAGASAACAARAGSPRGLLQRHGRSRRWPFFKALEDPLRLCCS
jgi:hypothetical protein